MPKRSKDRDQTKCSPQVPQVGGCAGAAYHITGTRKPYVPRGTKRIGYEQKRREVPVISLFV